MLWKRVVLWWMTLLALVFASAGASAQADVSLKPHIGAIDMVAAICIEAHGLASAEGHQENWDAVTTGTSDVPHAARELGANGLKTALKSASQAHKSGSTRLGHALQKHTSSRASGAFGKITGHPSTWHQQALKHFREIVRGPGGFQRVTNDKGITFLEKRLADGRGIRLQLDNTFKGFLD